MAASSRLFEMKGLRSLGRPEPPVRQAWVAADSDSKGRVYKLQGVERPAWMAEHGPCKGEKQELCATEPPCSVPYPHACRSKSCGMGATGRWHAPPFGRAQAYL
jgi:hypothetical protein